MLTLEHSAHDYDEATDGCRRLVRVTRDSARQEQRVKPDLETHPVAAFDYEEGVLRFSPFDLIPLAVPLASLWLKVIGHLWSNRMLTN
jgi:hypothetical protein